MGMTTTVESRSFTMSDALRIDLIEEIFQRFRRQTQTEPKGFSREYFQRFTQLLLQAIELDRTTVLPSIENRIASLVFPLDVNEPFTLEYQLRLIHYALRERFQLSLPEKNEFLHQLFHHHLLLHSSLLRHLALQIGLVLNVENLSDGELFHFIFQHFASDPNLYVRKTLAEFFAKSLPKEFYKDFLSKRNENELVDEILLRLPRDEQKRLIEEFHLYHSLIDRPSTREFVFQTGRFLPDETPLIFYLNRILEKSLRDYLHALLRLISSRFEDQQSIKFLMECLDGLFLLMQDGEIESIDALDPWTTFICEEFLEREISIEDLSALLLEALQVHLSETNGFLSQSKFYRSTLLRMVRKKITDEKTFSNLLRCLVPLSIPQEMFEEIVQQIEEKERSALLYRSFFHLIRHSSNGHLYLERLSPLVCNLLFEQVDPLHWDRIDCALEFLLDSFQPSWFDRAFLQQLFHRLIDHPNEYVQVNLIELIDRLVEHEHCSSDDPFLLEQLIHFTEHALADLARSALARTWNTLLNKTEDPTQLEQLNSIVQKQIHRLIGDGGSETELQCLKLIEKLGIEKNKDLLRFLIDDGANEQIRSEARHCLGEDQIDQRSTRPSEDILNEEFKSLLHWFDHPDEHLILDCD